jgi:hypothetical protein
MEEKVNFRPDLLKVGDLVDALDRGRKWFESTVMDIKDGKLFIVRLL